MIIKPATFFLEGVDGPREVSATFEEESKPKRGGATRLMLKLETVTLGTELEEKESLGRRAEPIERLLVEGVVRPSDPRRDVERS